jgi:molybdopterin synthase catalytic subunit
MSLLALRATPITADEVIAAVSHPAAGGIAVFVGVVRDLNDGRPVSLLEYHAYDAMAHKELARIADELRAELPGVELAALHRTGSLAGGDVAVVCAASAVHREQAFVASRCLIDRIKARLPIWKREHGPSGPYWVGWADARCVPGQEHAGHEQHGHEQ